MGDGRLVYALDLATTCGWASGQPRRSPNDPMPRSGAVLLKKAKQSRAAAFGNFVAFLQAAWTEERPDLCVVEAPKALAMLARVNAGQAVADMSYGYNAIVLAMCHRFGVEYDSVEDSTARKHFLSRGRLGSREETKAAVVRRCHLLGYMPRDRTDDNQADALCVWDWACAHLCRTPPAELHLHGEEGLIR